VLLVGGVSVLSPGFLQPLFATDVGNLILIGCIIWMAMGFFVMRAMMQVDL
jgi:tight adherence protein B